MLEYILMPVLLVLALLIIQQSSLRVAIIYAGVFSLVSSMVYLYHDAPDVALAEAVIGSTLATVLYLAALRKQEIFLGESSREQAKPRYRVSKSVKHQRVAAAGLSLLLLALVLYLFIGSRDRAQPELLRAYYMNNFFADTSAKNAVAAIYLQYRVYDTVFETLTLMISVMAVIFFSHHQGHIYDPGASLWQGNFGYRLENEQRLAAPLITLLYPFIMLLALYIILFGHDTPGGGFQGGAILSAILITRYIMLPINDMRMDMLQNIEKIAFIALLISAVYAGIVLWQDFETLPRTAYFIIMNLLIGIKVCMGISIIFIRFVFYESR